MRPWKLCWFFADGGGVRHGGEGWCLRERIPTIACYGRGLSIASGAPDLPPTCHTALAFSASARFPRRQTCGLADLERAPRSGAPGVVASGRVAALLSPLVSSPRAPLRGAITDEKMKLVSFSTSPSHASPPHRASRTTRTHPNVRRVLRVHVQARPHTTCTSFGLEAERCAPPGEPL